MNEVEPNGVTCVVMCAAICTGGCLTCIADGPVIIVDAVSGGTALTTGSSNLQSA